MNGILEPLSKLEFDGNGISPSVHRSILILDDLLELSTTKLPASLELLGVIVGYEGSSRLLLFPDGGP